MLDLFAGSGAMGLEALSRGAASAVFVEADRDAARAIERNLDRLRLTGATVLRQDARTALAGEAAARRHYDLVLVDPPYGEWEALESRLAPYLADRARAGRPARRRDVVAGRAATSARAAHEPALRFRAPHPLRAPGR